MSDMGQDIQEWTKQNLWKADHFKFFKGCLPQILLGPFLNILTHMLVRADILFAKRKGLRPKKISHVSGNRPGEKFFITHRPALSNVYQNIYFRLQKQKAK